MRHAKESLLIAVLLAIASGNLYDLVSDWRSESTSLHVLVEAAIILASSGLIAWLLTGMRRQRSELEQLRRELQERPAADAPSPEAASTRRQLGALIQGQFHSWQLTDSEQEIGLLLLKGLSFREIADLRQTHEKTVRAQASAIYRKAGVSGRHAFAAWFIEDFL